MENIHLSDAQLQAIAYYVRNLIRAESKSVGEVELVETLNNIESFPTIQNIGGIKKVVRAPVKLLSEPAWDAVSGLIDETNQVIQETNTVITESREQTREARQATESAYNAIEQVEQAAENANTAASDAREMQRYVDNVEAAIRDDMRLEDEATLTAANQYTDQREAVIRADQEISNTNILEEAKEYAKTVAASVVDNAPEALDTLKELSEALGNDPNFATTVMTEIGKKVTREQGKNLSTNDYTNEEKAKLAGIAAGANNYVHPGTHPASIIVQDSTRMFVTESEKNYWNNKADTTATGNYLPLTGGTLTGLIHFSNNTGGIQGNIGDNDFYRIIGGSTGTNAGYLEIATADDATEPIYVRQYTGLFANLARTLTLLDEAGNSSFPGNIGMGTYLVNNGKISIDGSDAWLRLNNQNHFPNGIYCGSGTFRTDGVLEVGDHGSSLRVPLGSSATAGQYWVFTAGAGTSSDMRYKEDVKEIPTVLDFIDKQEFISYTWNREYDKKHQTIGLNGNTFRDTATEEIKRLVHIGEDNDNLLTLEYDKIGGVIALKGVQELHEIIKRQEKTIELLAAKLGIDVSELNV